jgi:glucosamine--fructose-6-phosphate aminotransferase (isomerizing)
LIFTPTDAAAAGTNQLAHDLIAKGAALFATGSNVASQSQLETLAADQPETDAICQIQSFYAMVVRLAAARGVNVDEPRHLKKITRTR